MYNIGQVAKFLGVSRDTLKYYEEKGLVNPSQDEENGYRKYDVFDIHDILTTNFYREIDFKIKQIQEIRRSKSIEEIEIMLNNKEKKILEEIENKKVILKKIKNIKRDCKNIKENLGKFIIREMGPLEVRAEIESFKSFDQYEVIKENTENLRNAVIINSLRRVVEFDNSGIIANRFIVVNEVEDEEKATGKVIKYNKCLYTVLEDGRWLNGERSIDADIEKSLKLAAKNMNCILLGKVYAGILVTTYKDGLERIFLEIYAPIE